MEQASTRNAPARRRRPRPGSAVDQVRRTDFTIVMRGYDRAAVDEYVAKVAQLVAELEATQTSQGVVQRALDEVGEQTSSILQRAHETAEEIAARSRSQAEGRIQRAEQEAEELRRDAEQYAERIVEETRRLWEQRQRLIEDMRQLADEVLAVADDALDRVSPPDTDFVPGAPDEPLEPDAAVADPETTQAWELPPEEDPADAVVEAPPVDEAEDTEESPGPASAAARAEAEADTAQDTLGPDDDTTSEFDAPAAPKQGR